MRVVSRVAVALTGGVCAYALLLRTRQLRWGASADEALGALPGDEVLPVADLVATRAISVAAEPRQVWPWVAQLGQGRGGLYSYDWLENLIGCQMDSADVVVPKWQSPAPGDEFRLHPDVGLTVAHVDPPRAFVVQGSATADGAPATDGSVVPYDFTWAFVVVPEGQGGSRLLVRERYRCPTPWSRLIVEGVSLASFLMTERMLRGIRDRAEGRVEEA